MKSVLRGNRLSTLAEGQTGRYLGYALGEILLIILGIFIALQIDNWNDKRKAKTKFDTYIVQLREDVRSSIGNIEDFIESNRQYKDRCYPVFQFIHATGREPENIQDLEYALRNLGRYSEPQIEVGLLGQIFNGNKEELELDDRLLLQALNLEQQVGNALSVINHIFDWTDAQIAVINKYRAPAIAGFPEAGLLYDLQSIKTSGEFLYAAQNVVSMISDAVPVFGVSIKTSLEEFLKVLETYDSE